MTEALDLLGRKIGIGDHVVWGAGGRRTHGIRHGFVKEILPDGGGLFRVKTSGYPGSGYPGTTKWASSFCVIVLPDIQDPEVQLAD